MTKLSPIFTVLVLLLAIRALAQTSPPGPDDPHSPRPAIRTIPFSADSIHESDNLAADGRRYHHEVRAKIFRDSEGRFRQEILSGMGPVGVPGPTYVEILDPVQGLSITLSPPNKTASIRRSIQKATLPTPAPAPPAVSNSSENTPANEEPDFGPYVGMMTVDKNRNVIYRGPLQPEQLGSREIEGFTVTGTRNTWMARRELSGTTNRSHSVRKCGIHTI